MLRANDWSGLSGKLPESLKKRPKRDVLPTHPCVAYNLPGVVLVGSNSVLPEQSYKCVGPAGI